MAPRRGCQVLGERSPQRPTCEAPAGVSDCGVIQKKSRTKFERLNLRYANEPVNCKIIGHLIDSAQHLAGTGGLAELNFISCLRAPQTAL